MAEDTNTLTETQLVVFDLASEYYGVDIGDVREIIRMQLITRVPGAPSYVEGVINLRGRVVPVVDLRKRLKLNVGEQTKESRIVVVDIAGRDVGVVVDAVTEVLRVPLTSIEPPSSMITNSDSDYLRGIAKLESKLIILLDLNKVLSAIDKDKLLRIEETDITESTKTGELAQDKPVKTGKKRKLVAAASS